MPRHSRRSTGPTRPHALKWGGKCARTSSACSVMRASARQAKLFCEVCAVGPGAWDPALRRANGENGAKRRPKLAAKTRREVLLKLLFSFFGTCFFSWERGVSAVLGQQRSKGPARKESLGGRGCAEGVNGWARRLRASSRGTRRTLAQASRTRASRRSPTAHSWTLTTVSPSGRPRCSRPRLFARFGKRARRLALSPGGCMLSCPH